MLTWAIACGAGDENRTRTISLGSGAITAARGADLAYLQVPSDRGCPLVTLVNGTLMARPSRADLAQSGLLRVPCSSPVLLVAAWPRSSSSEEDVDPRLQRSWTWLSDLGRHR
jgi:hypothetical protein